MIPLKDKVPYTLQIYKEIRSNIHKIIKKKKKTYGALLGADYMRETGSLLAHQGVSKFWVRSENIFFSYMMTRYTRTIHKLKANQKYPFIIYLNSRG